MATHRPFSQSSVRLQTSKLLAIAVGVLLAVLAVVDHRRLLATNESTLVVDSVVVLTVVGLGLAGVVILEVVSVGTRLFVSVDKPVRKTPTVYRTVRVLEALVALCVLGGWLWLVDPSVGGAEPQGGLAVVAFGMVAVSLVRSALELSYARQQNTKLGR